ncbi:MAG TPA: SDR family oxidoreductase [Kofleriaceae bacterium]|nr:SDR family oxidoreductase [Kofleriaceae bacterium]
MRHRRAHEVVVITGASAGVGRATARQFARRGARIALLARGEDGLRGAARDVEMAGAVALPISVDVSDPAALEEAAERVEAELGPIDVWINNAMTTVFGRAVQLGPDELRRVTDVTYHGAAWGTVVALRRMVPRDRGVIVQVGSALAYRSIPLQAAYCAAKHALRGFTDSVRSELIHDGVRGVHLTMVQLPGLNTPQFRWCKSYMPNKAQPVPPIYQPEVAARAIEWATHHRRREVYVGLPSIKTVIGSKLLPGWLDHYLARVAWEGQQTGEREDPSRPVNLFFPVRGDHGAHGAFDRRARARDPVTWVSLRLGAAGVRAAAAALAVLVVSLAAVLLTIAAG